MRPASRLPLIDAVKVVATQLIVWHHLALYGPMTDALRQHAPGLIDWLVEDARIVVQVFLVIGGFLAARALWRDEGPGNWHIGAQLWRRYRRLARPYVVAVLAAVVSAAVARHLMSHEATPAAPTLAQLAAHLLLLQDVLGYPGLSAGVWYVAVDFQLFALLAAVLWLSRRVAPKLGVSASEFALCACGVLTLASLWVFNLDDALDIWAPYFFGAYGMGVLAARIARWPSEDRLKVTLTLAIVLMAALLLEWRSRIAVAGLTALALVWLADVRAPRWSRAALGRVDAALVQPLVRVSYAQFLIHYPVLLFVNACIAQAWPAGPVAAGVGMLVAWALSLWAAHQLHLRAEVDGPMAARPSSNRRWALRA